MICFSLILFVAGFVGVCEAQAAGWQKNQRNTTMCYWQNPRGAVRLKIGFENLLTLNSFCDS
jgi:hypothetical protein